MQHARASVFNGNSGRRLGSGAVYDGPGGCQAISRGLGARELAAGCFEPVRPRTRRRAAARGATARRTGWTAKRAGGPKNPRKRAGAVIVPSMRLRRL